jgi:signal transduction histidine kinase
VIVDVEQMIAELRRIADELAARPLPRETADPLGGVARAALAEEVASVIRHDMRNKLGSIRNAAFYLKRRVQPTELWQTDPRMSQFFWLIEETVVEATTMLEDSLGTKLRAPRRAARVSARECVDLAVASMDPGRVRLKIDAGTGVIEVDRVEMALALRCLLENAVEASSDGDVVDVSTREDGDSLVVMVTDEGAGVSAEGTDGLFAPFFTTKESHVGVGLKIARRIARRQGGDLSLVAAPRGMIATLLVPLADGGHRHRAELLSAELLSTQDPDHPLDPSTEPPPSELDDSGDRPLGGAGEP